MAQLMHCHSLSLASVKSRLVLPFWYRLTWVVPEKGPGIQHPTTQFLQAGCPSCRPYNSVKALKEYKPANDNENII